MRYFPIFFLLLHFLLFSFSGLLDGKIHEMTSFFFLVNEKWVWYYGRDWVNRVYLKLLLSYDSLGNFSHKRYLMASHWSLSDSKSLQVTRTLLSILAYINNTVVLMVSTCSFISKLSNPLTNPLGIVPRIPSTISITVT